MGKRGPGSRSDSTKLDTIRKKPPEPLPGMTRGAHAVWYRIVNTYQPGYYKAHQYDLLRAYCEAAATHKKATKMVKIDGEVIIAHTGAMKSNPWMDVITKSAGTMASLSTKLGLNANTSTHQNRKRPMIKDESETSNPRAGLMFGGS